MRLSVRAEGALRRMWIRSRATSTQARAWRQGLPRGRLVCELWSPFEVQEYREVVRPVRLSRAERICNAGCIVTGGKRENLSGVLHQVAGRIREPPLGARDRRRGPQPHARLNPVHLVQRSAQADKGTVEG